MERYNYNLRSTVIWAIVLEAILTGITVLFWASYRRLFPGLKLGSEHFIWIPLILPILSVAYLFTIFWKNKALNRFGDTRLLSAFAQPISSKKTNAKFILLRVGLWFLALALLDPKMGSKLSEAKTEGIDLVFCIDVSNSMLAQDIKPNRLQAARRVIEKTVDELHGDRIGIIVFAGQAYTQLPITNDYSAAKLFLSTINTGIVPVQGTAIGAAIDLAQQSFDPESPAAKAIVVITDGENHEDDAVAQAEFALNSGIVVHCIGMGSTSGSPIPVGKNNNFKKDKGGQVVVSKLNAELISSIANAGGGLGIYANNNNAGTSLLLDSLNKMQKAELDVKNFTDFENRFQWLLVPALLCLLLDLLITNRKRDVLKKYNPNV
jgi:Ca-activated chloride channel family protein